MTYQDLKTSLENDYKYFNKIMGSVNIYNPEFKKLNSMFRGLTKKTTYIKRQEWDQKQEKLVSFKEEYLPYYTAITGGEFYGHSLSKEEQDKINIDFPNIKNDYKSLLARKAEVKLGKRPVCETEEHKQKMLQRALESDLGKCGYCEKYHEIEKGVIYDHGFKMVGYRAGVCYGANLKPYERSPEAKELLVKHIKAKLNSILKQKPTQKIVDYLNSNVFKYQDQKSCDEYNNKFAYYSNQVKIGDYIQNSKDRNYLGIKIYGDAKLEKLNTLYTLQKNDIEKMLSVEEEKLKNWKAKPTLREQAVKNKGGQ